MYVCMYNVPADDTTPPPHECDAAIVEVPAVDLGSLAEQHEALGVGDYLGGIESLPDQLYKLFPEGGERERRRVGERELIRYKVHVY